MKPSERPPNPERTQQFNKAAQESLEVLLRLERLKQIPRTGWVLRGVRGGDTDSVADHTALTGVISIIIGHLLHQEGVQVNVDTLARIAILHDLAEVVTGDLDRENLQVFGRDFHSQKHDAEQKVLRDLFGSITSAPEIYAEIQSLLQNPTVETRVVKIADRLEACLQALAFIEGGYAKSLFAPFFKNLEELQTTVSWRSIQNLITAVLSKYERL